MYREFFELQNSRGKFLRVFIVRRETTDRQLLGVRTQRTEKRTSISWSTRIKVLEGARRTSSRPFPPQGVRQSQCVFVHKVLRRLFLFYRVERFESKTKLTLCLQEMPIDQVEVMHKLQLLEAKLDDVRVQLAGLAENIKAQGESKKTLADAKAKKEASTPPKRVKKPSFEPNSPVKVIIHGKEERATVVQAEKAWVRVKLGDGSNASFRASSLIPTGTETFPTAAASAEPVM